MLSPLWSVRSKKTEGERELPFRERENFPWQPWEREREKLPLERERERENSPWQPWERELSLRERENFPSLERERENFPWERERFVFGDGAQMIDYTQSASVDYFKSLQ
jgi:hypothetical protein